MTTMEANRISSVYVPYYSKAGKYQKVEAYRVTRTSTGYHIAGPRGAYDLLLQDGELFCGCEGFRMSIEKHGDEIPPFCRHICLVAQAHIMIAEIRAEATPTGIECDFCNSTGTLTAIEGYQEPCDMCEGGTIQPTAETYAAKMAEYRAIGQQMVADLESIKIKPTPVAYTGTMIDFDPFVDAA